MNITRQNFAQLIKTSFTCFACGDVMLVVSGTSYSQDNS